MLVRPISMNPAARSRAMTGASLLAGGLPARTVDPARVRSPSTSNRSLTEIGMPAKDDGARPVLRMPSSTSADSRAPRFTVRNARHPSPAGSSIRAKHCSTSWRLVTEPLSSRWAKSAIHFRSRCSGLVVIVGIRSLDHHSGLRSTRPTGSWLWGTNETPA